MALANCFECNRMFDSRGGARRCQGCLDAQERDWKLVRDFVKSNPGIHLDRVVEATEVPAQRIREFITAGLLEPEGMTGAGYPCHKCGTQITRGEYCNSCLSSLGRQVADSLEKSRETPSGRPSNEPAKPSGAFATQFRQRYR